MTIDYPAAHQIQALRELWQEAFGDSDAFLDAFFETAFSPERCRVVTEEGRIAAALYWLDCQCAGRKFAYLYAVATGHSYRRRGLCRALMADTHNRLAESGYAGAILVPGEPSLRAFYAGMGYLPGGKIATLKCAPGDKAALLRPIGPAEYARRRAQLLPENGVIQVGENLDFLAGICRLYDGGDFLLAANVEDGVIRGLELLGNTTAAPGIVAALEAELGEFRIPGDEFPFAMYYPLTANCPEPGYFGLAFD